MLIFNYSIGIMIETTTMQLKNNNQNLLKEENSWSKQSIFRCSIYVTMTSTIVAVRTSIIEQTSKQLFGDQPPWRPRKQCPCTLALSALCLEERAASVGPHHSLVEHAQLTSSIDLPITYANSLLYVYFHFQLLEQMFRSGCSFLIES